MRYWIWEIFYLGILKYKCIKKCWDILALKYYEYREILILTWWDEEKFKLGGIGKSESMQIIKKKEFESRNVLNTVTK